MTGDQSGSGGLILDRSEIEEAAARIAPFVRRTPVMDLEPGFAGIPGRIALKLEHLQVTGSFKTRGAFNLLLSGGIPETGVVAASGGNFGLAVAHAARRLDVPAAVYVPDSSPRAKIDRLGRLGADVRVIPGYYADALAAAEESVATSGAAFAHAYDQREVVAGQGTCGRELLEQVPDVDTVLVAVGGGGLIAGIASWLRDDVRVVSVETDGTPALHAARSAGEPVDVEVGGTAASSLGARRVGEHAWAASVRWVDEALLVTDADVVVAQRVLWDQIRQVVEPGGAVTVAALLSGRYRPDPDERVVALVCGANVDPATLA